MLATRFYPLLNDARFRMPRWLMRSLGPFAFQENCATRTFEYPWVQAAAELRPGMRVLDIGAGASGLQFVLAAEGCEVVSVDPLVNPDETVDWVFTEREFQRLNRAFGSRVKFIRKTVEEAGLEESSIDRALAVSVLEHVPDEACLSIVREVARVLKPGGLFVLTIDLFLDCAPFTERRANRWGENRDVRAMVEASGLRMRTGKPSELCGFIEFKPGAILAAKDRHLRVGDVMTQCVVLEKPRG
jgi:SAM-dependent methyltransferase